MEAWKVVREEARRRSDTDRRGEDGAPSEVVGYGGGGA